MNVKIKIFETFVIRLDSIMSLHKYSAGQVFKETFQERKIRHDREGTIDEV